MKSSVFVLLLLLLTVACSPPEATVARETVIVQIPTTVEVTRIVEVTRLVDRPITVTPTSTAEATNTPRATPTPRATGTPRPTAAPSLGTRANPYSMGRAAPLVVTDKELAFTLTVLEVLRGEPAWQRIQAANQFNNPPPQGFEFVLIRTKVEYVGDDKGVLEMNKNDMAIVTNGRIIRWSDTIGYNPCCVEPEFDFSLLAGGYGEGWLALPVAINDNDPLLLIGDSIYFALSR